jgi:hypothetical protein
MELSSRSVILLVDSEYKLWYSHLLEPFIHYIPIHSDLSNLIETLKWCKTEEGDAKCQEIATNAYNFYKENLETADLILDNLQSILIGVGVNETKLK